MILINSYLLLNTLILNQLVDGIVLSNAFLIQFLIQSLMHSSEDVYFKNLSEVKSSAMEHHI